MRQIIEKKVYDTETAEEIFFEKSSLSISDFRYMEETLYRTPKGRYFIYGKGGPLSKYAKWVGDGHTGGSKIIPLSDEQAFEFCVANGGEDIAEELFPELIEEA